MEQETPFNVYYEKLQAQKIKNCQIQSNEDNLERGVNTDEIETADAFNHFPEDRSVDYFKLKREQDMYAIGEDVKEYDAADLAKRLNNLVVQSTPVLETLIVENQEFANFENPKAKEQKSFEEKMRFKLPDLALKILDCSLDEVTQISSFDMIP